MTTTPDPITTAHGWTDEVRQAVTALEDKYGIELISGPHHAKWADAACYEIGGGAIRMYKADVEKLKAERDEFAATIVTLAEHRNALTSQLEQAERVIAPFAEFVDCLDEELPDDEEYNTELGLEGYHSLTCGNFRKASQWIKDRQAKTDAALSKGIKE